MKNVVVLAALAGIASAAAAGSNATLSIVASQSVVDSSATSSITLQVFGDASIATHITGAAFTMNATGGAGVVGGIALDSVAAWGALGEDSFGDAGDGNHAGAIMGQIAFLPFIQPDAASMLGNGPVLLGTFVVDIIGGSEGDVTWTVGGIAGTDFAIELLDVNANPGGNPPGETFQILDPSFGSATVSVVPAPSAMALLGLGGLLAGQHHR
ncbi:MAG: hypothetical protein AB8C13_09530 [Phycisphaerales bacterium]